METNIFMVFRAIFGFDTQWIMPESGTWGVKNKTTGQWNGCVKELELGRADVSSSGLTVTMERLEVSITFCNIIKYFFTSGLIPLKVIDYMKNMIEENIVLFYRVNAGYSVGISAFFDMFHQILWLTIFGFTLLLSIVFLLINSYTTVPFHKDLSVMKSFSLICLALIQRDLGLEMRSPSSKVMFTSVFCLTFIIYATYTAALTSVMTLAPSSPLVTSFQDILDRDLELYVWRGSIELER